MIVYRDGMNWIAERDTGEKVPLTNDEIQDIYWFMRREKLWELDAYANGLPYMIDSGDFILDSLFCEYGYIINLDKNVLEFWIGYQKKVDKDNRYGTKETDGYYPCKLLAQFSLNKLDDDVVKVMNRMSETEYMEADNE